MSVEAVVEQSGDGGMAEAVVVIQTLRWVGPSLYPVLRLSLRGGFLQIFLEIDFSRKCEKSVANLWECESVRPVLVLVNEGKQSEVG